LDVDADDDEIIADPYFASVLNENREILVDNKVYRFTEKGLFYTDVNNYDNLDKTIQMIQPCKINRIDEEEVDVGNGVVAFIPQAINNICIQETIVCCSPDRGIG